MALPREKPLPADIVYLEDIPALGQAGRSRPIFSRSWVPKVTLSGTKVSACALPPGRKPTLPAVCHEGSEADLETQGYVIERFSTR